MTAEVDGRKKQHTRGRQSDGARMPFVWPSADPTCVTWPTLRKGDSQPIKSSLGLLWWNNEAINTYTTRKRGNQPEQQTLSRLSRSCFVLPVESSCRDGFLWLSSHRCWQPESTPFSPPPEDLLGLLPLAWQPKVRRRLAKPQNVNSNS